MFFADVNKDSDNSKLNLTKSRAAFCALRESILGEIACFRINQI
jgi:hypothetical protein